MGKVKELPVQYLGLEEFETVLKTEWPLDTVTSKQPGFKLIATDSQYHLYEAKRYNGGKYYKCKVLQVTCKLYENETKKVSSITITTTTTTTSTTITSTTETATTITEVGKSLLVTLTAINTRFARIILKNDRLYCSVILISLPKGSVAPFG